ncbi:hypothetical protein [Tautonia rosea]|uniref:hypothetical protein n=1 Tax=Tautonia rosea TaxID=2728037 RepID=UPI001472FEBC|nr:hypothetical protein [Tautonia rosea]
MVAATSQERGSSIVLRDTDNADEAIDRIIESRPESDTVVWQGGRIIAVIRSERGGTYPAIISP